jgi:glycosyltransferase involved in cell wall biosynthesis
MNKDIKVLVFSAHYIPGYKGGGPIRTIANMVSLLGDDINFMIITQDRDLGDKKPYVGILSEVWLQVGKSQVYYSSMHKWAAKISRIIKNFDGNAIDFNSFFSWQFTILPLLITKIYRPNLPIILGPRGEFSFGAMKLKTIKKIIYINFFKLLGLHHKVIWHASTELEALDILRLMGKNVRVRIGADISIPPLHVKLNSRDKNEPFRMIFVSRISPMKNLLFAIKILGRVKPIYPIIYNVYGPIEDEIYWEKCLFEAKKLPAHISFNYKGGLSPSQLTETMTTYDLFFMPTMGENFGHIIAEALGCGLPVLIANTTPWKDLHQKKLGWDISLGSQDEFVKCIEFCFTIHSDEYHKWRKRIRSWAMSNIGGKVAIKQYHELFINLE